MAVGDIVRIQAAGTLSAKEHNGKLGLVISYWTSPGYLGGDTYVDVLVEGIKMCFHADELQDVEDEAR